MAKIRIVAARTLKAAGLSYAQIGRFLGVTRQRAQQMVSGKRRPEPDDEQACFFCTQGPPVVRLDRAHITYGARAKTVLLCVSCHLKFDGLLGRASAGDSPNGKRNVAQAQRVIAWLRDKHSLSQGGLASRIGVSSRSISHYEDGRRFPSLWPIYRHWANTQDPVAAEFLAEMMPEFAEVIRGR